MKVEGSTHSVPQNREYKILRQSDRCRVRTAAWWPFAAGWPTVRSVSIYHVINSETVSACFAQRCGASCTSKVFNLEPRQSLICCACCLSRRAEVCVFVHFRFSVSISRHAPTLDLSKKTSTSLQWRLACYIIGHSSAIGTVIKLFGL